eukprot:gene10510-12232_t
MTTPLTSLVVKILNGDAKALLAFNLDEKDTKDLAGFTILCQPGNSEPYYLFNKLQFADPSLHAQVATEPAASTINAPIQKFRWLHVPGNIHQKDKVFYGDYTYTVTPRYFNKGQLLPIDRNLSVTISTQILKFAKGNIELGFTRGFTQSQAFIKHFGPNSTFRPKKAGLLFDTSAQAGINTEGVAYSFQDEYIWSGFTAREKIFDLVNEVLQDESLFLDVFAYDLNEPDLMSSFLQLAKEGRIRFILDDAALHHDPAKPKPEDQFEVQFRKVDVKPGGVNAIQRGNFKRYQHHKVMVVSKGAGREAVKVLSGSTNFSVTGMYVNSNHIILFKDQAIVALYQQLFNTVWAQKVQISPFMDSVLSQKEYPLHSGDISLFFTFAPHNDQNALANLNKIVSRVNAEQSSVFFAVMGTDPTTTGPVAPALINLHKRTDIFSAGITDSSNSLTYYKASSNTGIRVTGKPGNTLLPPPFDKELSISFGHQVHHKFIVCGFNTPNAVVWLGSSNLALGGEMENGDNLIEIRDKDIATVFALEAIALVDHFQFRNRHAAPKKTASDPVESLSKSKLAAYNLYTDNKWAKSYYKDGDLHKMDRELFAQ